RADVGERRALAVPGDLQVPTRDARVRQAEVGVLAAAHDVAALLERVVAARAVVELQHRRQRTRGSTRGRAGGTGRRRVGAALAVRVLGRLAVGVGLRSRRLCRVAPGRARRSRVSLVVTGLSVTGVRVLAGLRLTVTGVEAAGLQLTVTLVVPAPAVLVV